MKEALQRANWYPPLDRGPYTAELWDESQPGSPVAIKDRDGRLVAVMSQQAFRRFRDQGTPTTSLLPKERP